MNGIQCILKLTRSPSKMNPVERKFKHGTREPTWSMVSLIGISLLVLCPLSVVAQQDECGTRFTDPASSTVLAQVVLEGSVMNMHSHNMPTSANISVNNIYKGLDVLNNREMMGSDNTITVTPFGNEDRDNCVASAIAIPPGSKHVFFLRQTSQRGMLRLSAMPLPMQEEVERRVKRSLCDTCVAPPHIEEIACKDCALEPSIRDMRNRKVREGRRTRIRCQVKGNPDPTISWYREGTRFSEDDVEGISVQETRKASTLVIAKAKANNTGQYRCVATNELGQNIKVVRLEVVPKRQRPSRPPRPPRPSPPTRRRPTTTQPKVNISTPQTTQSRPENTSRYEEKCQNHYCTDGSPCYHTGGQGLHACVCSDGSRCESQNGTGAVSSTNASSFSKSTSDSKNASIDNLDISKEERTQNQLNNRASKISHQGEINNATKGSAEEAHNNTTHPAHQSSPDSKSLAHSPSLAPPTSNAEIITPNPKLTSKSQFSHANTRYSFDASQNPGDNVHFTSQTNSGVSNTKTGSSSSDKGYSRGTDTRDIVWLKTRRKKSRYCKEKSFCLHGGRCKVERKTGVKFCECPKGFTGNRCEQLFFGEQSII